MTERFKSCVARPTFGAETVLYSKYSLSSWTIRKQPH